MRAIYMMLNGLHILYQYKCKGCGTPFAVYPVYYPSGKACKHCPECGHKFELPHKEEKIG